MYFCLFVFIHKKKTQLTGYLHLITVQCSFALRQMADALTHLWSMLGTRYLWERPSKDQKPRLNDNHVSHVLPVSTFDFRLPFTSFSWVLNSCGPYWRVVKYCALLYVVYIVLQSTMQFIKRLLDLYIALQALFALSWGFSDTEPGPVAGSQSNGDRFRIEGRAVVPGVKTQDWISTARILVEGEEYIGFLKWVKSPAILTSKERCKYDYLCVLLDLQLRVSKM